ncbi:hypothetical protein HZC00_01905 [Candidatus Kaiserbacteria bacterium]|nr:hypothetical protein [Candidatus Kaiserbacteria bacterium]
MSYLFGSGSRRGLSTQTGSTILAALLLVAVAGIFSMVLHYGSSLNDRLAYQTQGLTAAADYSSPIAPAPAPLNLSSSQASDQPTKTETTPPKKCKDNKVDSGQIKGGSTGANRGAIQFTAECLPGCKYKVSVSGDSSSAEGEYQATNPEDVSDSSKPCTVCDSNGCYSQKIGADGKPVPGSTMQCDSSGNNCKPVDQSTVGKSTATDPAAAQQALQAAAKEVAAQASLGTTAGTAQAQATADDFLTKNPGLAKDFGAALEQQKANIPINSEESAYPTIDNIQQKIASLAGPDAGGSTPAPSGDFKGQLVPIGAAADVCQGDTNCLSMFTPQAAPGGTPAPAPGTTPAPGGNQPPCPYGYWIASTDPIDVRCNTQPNTSFGDGPGGGGMTSGVMSFLGGMMRGMGYGGMGGYGGYGGYGGMGGYGAGGYGVPPGNTIPQGAGACNTQYMCQGQTLLYRNNQCVDQPMQQCPYGCNGNQCAQQNGQQQQQGQYGYGTNNQPCMQPPMRPDASTCTTGTWKATSATNNGCTTGWQCVADGGSTNTASPIASLSCQSQVADVGSTFAISYSCQRAVTSLGGGFDTQGQLTGGATVTIGDPPAGTNTATYTLGCRNSAGLTVGAQCSVQINKPLIALTVNPSSVAVGATSTVGWVTSGMQSCVVSSPDNAIFTAQNASSTNVNGVAVTPHLTATTHIQLNCRTFGGGIRATSTTISVQ